MAEKQMYSLIDELEAADQKYTGSPSLLGMTALSFPGYVNSMRSTMFTSHLKQFKTLTHPDFPYLFTNVENVVGKHSGGYKKTKHKYEVYRKVEKFGDILDTPMIYKLFLFDKENGYFDVITRKPVEDLTENFGYAYNNDEIDSYEEGDTIKKNTVLYKSTSYDDDMNFAYGQNINVMYTLDPFTSEDAAVASESLSRRMTSIETEVITIPLNDNDYLINLYGKNGEFKVLPEVGETCKGCYLAASRRLFKSQILSDFKESNLQTVQEGDTVFYIDAGNTVLDYTIYNNNEEIVETDMNRQLLKYYDSQTVYFDQICETCEEIIKSGYKYSRDIDYLYKRSKEMLDKEKKWKEGDSAFSNMVIEITVRRIDPLAKGCKVTGRFGNKSVISRVLPDNEMPHTADGRQVDLMLNLLAIINRTTAMPLYEIAFNSINHQVRRRLSEMDSLEKQADFYFEIMYIYNEKEAKFLKDQFEDMSEKEQEEFMNDVINDGIYVHQPPMWETKPIFYRLKEILDKYEWVKPDDIYINKWGREIKCLNKAWLGEMYVVKLKQSDRRGFSVRSTGAIDTKSLPTRSYKSRSHLEQTSGSAIRFGEFETLNFSIGILPEDIALYHAMYRTSIKGRKDLMKLMFHDVDSTEFIDNIDNSYTSRVAEIFQVILKSLSIGLEFLDDEDMVYPLDNDEYTIHQLDNETYFCTEYEFFLIQRLKEIEQDILEQFPIITTDELIKKIKEELVNRDYVMGTAEDALKMIDVKVER